MPLKLTEEQYKKELAAQKNRVKAMEHLKTTGCGPGAFEDTLNSRGAAAALSTKRETTYSTDNTLDILRKRRATEEQAKRAILQQQQNLRTSNYASSGIGSASSNRLPSGWQAVVDPSSKKTYYWNQKTNETTWTRPPPDATDSSNNTNINNNTCSSDDDLPAGWLAVLHGGTGQIYYIHQGTKEKRWSRPTAADDASDIPDTKRKSALNSDSTKSSSSCNVEPAVKRRKQAIDPLDPTGGKGQWLSGATADGKMADSTASGPLWQQRPYPAPSAALKSRDVKSVHDANIGPSLK